MSRAVPLFPALLVCACLHRCCPVGPSLRLPRRVVSRSVLSLAGPGVSGAFRVGVVVVSVTAVSGGPCPVHTQNFSRSPESSKCKITSQACG